MNVSKLFLLAFVAVGLVGCGEGMKSLNDPDGNAGLGIEVTDPGADEEISAIGDSELEDANKLADDVDSDIDQGKLDFDDLLDTSKLEDIKVKFDDALSPIFKVLDDAKAKILDLKAKVQAEIDLLDPSIPEHAEAIVKLEKVLAKLDKAIAKIDKVAEKILGQVDKLYAKIDKLIDKIDQTSLIWIIIKSEFRRFNDDKVGGMRLLLLAFLAK